MPDVEARNFVAAEQTVVAFDHRFAPRRPALASAPSKKSFSSVNSPLYEFRHEIARAVTSGVLYLPHDREVNAPSIAGQGLYRSP